jgi:hypothetical protein
LLPEANENAPLSQVASVCAISTAAMLAYQWMM